MSGIADRDPLAYAALGFLRTIDHLRLPVVGDHVTLEQLQAAAAANDEAWAVSMLEREKWIGHSLKRLKRGAVEYGERSFTRPVVELLDELAEAAADLGAWAAIASHALAGRDDLEADVRALVGQALRDAAAGGARAWARIDQVRALLTVSEGETS